MHLQLGKRIILNIYDAKDIGSVSKVTVDAPWLGSLDTVSIASCSWLAFQTL